MANEPEQEWVCGNCGATNVYDDSATECEVCTYKHGETKNSVPSNLTVNFGKLEKKEG